MNGDPALPPGEPEQMRARGWCGDASCDPGTRQILDDNGRPRFTMINRTVTVMWCPRCSPHGGATAGRPPPEFTCPVCHAGSYNPNDRRYGYCGRCHDFTGAPDPTMTYDVDSGRCRERVKAR